MQFAESILILVSTPIYAILIGAEVLMSSYFKAKKYSVFGTFENVYLMLLNMGFDLLMRSFTLFILSYFYSISIFKIDAVLWYWIILLIFRRFYVLLVTLLWPLRSFFLGHTCDASFFARIQSLGWLPIFSISTLVSVFILYSNRLVRL